VENPLKIRAPPAKAALRALTTVSKDISTVHLNVDIIIIMSL
jgi:hypothetical protein